MKGHFSRATLTQKASVIQGHCIHYMAAAVRAFYSAKITNKQKIYITLTASYMYNPRLFKHGSSYCRTEKHTQLPTSVAGRSPALPFGAHAGISGYSESPRLQTLKW